MFRIELYKFIFIFGYMCFGFLLFINILSFYREILGYGEIYIKYVFEFDLKKLLFKVYNKI